ncbi:hypothetical protein H8356DRAFT_1728794 [Neocallimastix lanati (nom. inval.)]|nr:hypothetical protein H8356DRAFT_1728794 [Neocallimastix sp. JGI-2020a]
MKMKFTFKLLTLLTVSSVLSYSIQDDLKKRLDLNFEDLGEAAKCLTSLSNFQECKIDTTNLKNDKESVCNSFNSEKCQKVLKDGIKAIPECKDLPTEVLAASPLLFEILSSGIGLACSKDENGNYCPLSDIIITNDGKLNKEDQSVQMAVIETCKSKQCTDAAIDTLNRVETAEMLSGLSSVNFKRQEIKAQTHPEIDEKSISEYKLILEYFKSDNCTQAQIANNNDTSDAYSTFKLYTAFLVTFAIILPNFF